MQLIAAAPPSCQRDGSCQVVDIQPTCRRGWMQPAGRVACCSQGLVLPRHGFARQDADRGGSGSGAAGVDGELSLASCSAAWRSFVSASVPIWGVLPTQGVPRASGEKAAVPAQPAQKVLVSLSSPPSVLPQSARTWSALTPLCFPLFTAARARAGRMPSWRLRKATSGTVARGYTLPRQSFHSWQKQAAILAWLAFSQCQFRSIVARDRATARPRDGPRCGHGWPAESARLQRLPGLGELAVCPYLGRTERKRGR
jgi:hypothetical protein